MSEWISVEDELPSGTAFVYDGKDVFISDWITIPRDEIEDIRNYDCDWFKYIKKTDHCWFGYIPEYDYRGFGVPYENITHWMEIKLPKPPEVKDE